MEFKTIIHEGRIDNEEVTSIIERCEAAIMGGQKVRLCINSEGGSSAYGRLLLSFLNDNKDSVTLRVTIAVYSVAFYIFYKFQGEKELTFGARGMWHLPAIDVAIAANGRPQGAYSKAELALVKGEYHFFNALSSKFLSKSEMKHLRAGNDILFGFDRMVKIFPSAKIIE